MKVFLSWSGESSKQIAEAFEGFIRLIQAVKPFCSPDIPKGSNWLQRIRDELQNTSCGMIFLTKDNLDSPWILFEAGALAKQVSESKVCPLLFGLRPTEVTPPLSAFQLTEFTDADMKSLFFGIAKDVRAANEVCPEDRELDPLFSAFWPTTRKKIEEILAGGSAKPKTRTTDEKLDEVLLIARQMSRSVSALSASIGGVSLSESLEHVARQGRVADAIRVLADSGTVSDELRKRISRITDELLGQEATKRPKTG